MRNALSLNTERRNPGQDTVTLGWIRRWCCRSLTPARIEGELELTEQEILEDLDYGR